MHRIVFWTTAVCILISFLGCSDKSTQPPTADVAVSIGSESGTAILPLIGINIGPLPSGTNPANADLSEAYRSIGIKLIRTHDYYGPMDMAVFYPDRTRDPHDPASFDFEAGDRVWRAIVEGGFEPYFRLGDSWNNAKPPANAKESENWAIAAVHIVEHYRKGLWSGFTTPFRYVEIWNEPDNAQFWPPPRSAVDYFRLYVETSKRLREAFPDLKIGGPAVTQMGCKTVKGKEWVASFLSFIKKENAPFDFFSWHLYANDPEEYRTAAREYRSLLDAEGFANVDMHITEWNTDIRNLGENSSEALALRTGGRGAAALSGAWIVMQEEGIRESLFYRGPDPDMNVKTFYGMFYADGKPKRIALACSLWYGLTKHPSGLLVTASPAGRLYLAAGVDKSGEKALLAVNAAGDPISYTIPSLSGQRLTLLQVNDSSEQIQTATVTGERIDMQPWTVQLLTWQE